MIFGSILFVGAGGQPPDTFQMTQPGLANQMGQNTAAGQQANPSAAVGAQQPQNPQTPSPSANAPGS